MWVVGKKADNTDFQSQYYSTEDEYSACVDAIQKDADKQGIIITIIAMTDPEHQ